MSSISHEKPFLILERFISVKQLPGISVNSISEKKVVLLKNIYSSQKCIMKVQPKSLLDKKDRNILHEASFFQKFQGHLGIPLMIWSGQDFDCLVLIIQQLGPSIYKRMRFNCRQSKMRIKDVCMIGISLLQIIENLHDKDYLHRNITPQAFSFGFGDRMTKLYANDLLYMKKYRIKNNSQHIQQKQNVKLQYITPFLSKNVLRKIQPSRRDDIISICYVLIFLIKGKLPWQEDWQQEIALKHQSIKQKNSKFMTNTRIHDFNNSSDYYDIEKLKRMIQIQQNIPIEQLCRDLPKQFHQILQLSYQLEFHEKPEYAVYKALLKKALYKLKCTKDHLFQWMESSDYMRNNLLVDPNILNLRTLKQQQIQKLVYEPYEQKVNVDKYSFQKNTIQRFQRNDLCSQSKDRNQNDGKNQNNKIVNYQKINKDYQKHRKCQII